MQLHARNLNRVLPSLALAAATATAPACDEGEDEPVLRILDEGFDLPESAHFHPATRTWFVSNISGESGVKDGVGWVARLDRNGDFIDERWFDGLDAPTGLVSDDERLYVVDIDRVHVIDIDRALEIETIEFEGATFLNDPTLAPDGTLYVSDSFGQAIWRRATGERPEIVLQDEALESPNGLLWDEGRILVASIGPFMDFEVDASMQWLDPQSGELSPGPDVRGKFDGVERDGSDLWVTDFRGQLLRIDAHGEVHVRDLTLDGLGGAADLGIDTQRRVVAVPDLLGNRVALIPVGE